MSTTIRTTCSSCRQTSFLMPSALVLSLPAAAAAQDEPIAVHGCPACGASTSRTVTWRTAAYLVEAGVTSVVAPDPEELAPHYPEQRPVTTDPMTLDDLLDLLASLEPDARAA